MAYKTFTADMFTTTDFNTYLMNQAVIVCTSGTRPSSPVTGMRVWQTDTLSACVYNGVSWVFVYGLHAFARKTADESVTSSTTLQDDDHLSVPLMANSRYVVTCYVIQNSPTAADLQIGWSGSGVTWQWATFAPHTAQTNRDVATISINSLGIGGVADAGGFAADAVAIPRGLATVGGSNATFTLRWAQSTNTASATTIRANSWLLAERVA